MKAKLVTKKKPKFRSSLQAIKGSCAKMAFAAGSQLKGKAAPRAAMKAFRCEIGEDEEFCGALTGAMAAIGFVCGEHPRPVPGERLKKISKEFYEQFHARFGSHYCHDVCGRDMDKAEGAGKTCVKKGRSKACKHVVAESLDMVAETLEKNGVHIVR